MALQKQALPINFAKGLNTKSDPLQVPIGDFVRLKNSVFQKTGLLQKRNGYMQLASLPDALTTFLTTFNGNLTAIGKNIEAYSSGANTWINKSTLQPLELSTIASYRSNTNQSQCDSATSDNGLICTAFTDTISSSTVYKYLVQDMVTGQNIVAPTTLANASGSPRVFVLGNYFVIVFTATIAATPHLQYVAINQNSFITTAATDISTTYTPASTVAFDGFVANNNLYVAWNGSDGGGAIRVSYLDSTLNQHGTVVFASSVATIVSVTADLTTVTPVVYVTFYNLGTTTMKTLAVDQNLNTIFTPVSVLAAGTILNVTSSAQAGVASVFYETQNAYSYDAAIKTNFISVKTVTQAGSVSSATVVERSVGLASKSFIFNSTIYFLSVYNSSYQPTFFLIDSSGNVLAKLAYENAGGYLTLGLPAVSVFDNKASISYLIRDLILPINKLQGASNAGLGVYAQTGINLATFTIGTSNVSTGEIGTNLHLTGGFMWMYDGFQSVEHGFFLWPDNIEIQTVTDIGSMTPQQYYWQAVYEWADNQGNIHRSAPSIPVGLNILAPSGTFTGLRTSGSAIVTSVSSLTGLQVGQVVSGTGFAGGTTIKSIDSATQITLSNNASSGSGTSTTFTATAISTVQINVPTLRLTYKISSPVKITIFRWSTAQQTYFQITSVSSPSNNSKTIDSVSYTDSYSDAQILGNSIIYTTGGVVENIAAPSPEAIALYRSRLFLIDSEDENLLWYSKQVIEATPVEMSDLFTVYVAPTQGSQGSTGNMKCLSALDDKLIIFKRDAIYYITGNGPDNTGANNDFSDPVFITSTVGCDNQQSIVFIPQGLMFQSDKGIWLLGRDLSTTYIGSPVEAFNDDTVLSAVCVPGTNQVRFTLESGTTLMYDYFYGQWGTFEGVPAISSTLFQDLHTFVNQYGQVFQESPGAYLDGATPVVMGFTTGPLNMAGVQGFERAYWFNFIGQFISPHRLVVNVAYDYDLNSQQTIITPDNYNGPYGIDPLYGSTYIYGGTPTLEQWRVFFQKQNVESFQISVDEVFDATYGAIAGAGLSLSGINVMYGIAGNYPRLPANRSTG